MKLKLITLALGLGLTLSANADRFKDVKVTTKAVAGSIYMLSGYGGNIGVSAGKDGVVIIDDQFAELSDKIKAAIKPLAKEGGKTFLVNTHYHGDHTGGNAKFADHAVIMAHENVRIRLLDKKDPKMLPVLTYKDGIKVHLNDETIHIRHLPKGHTDGDSYVYFEKANVIHAGDLFFQGRFPYIDTDGGGSIKGYQKSVATIIKFAKDDTKIIPGHGKLADKKEYQKFLNMIKETRGWVQTQKHHGLTLQETIKKGLPKQWKSWSWGFITEEKWIRKLWSEK